MEEVIQEMKVIEFLGMPRAGKTTAVEIVESVMKREGRKVRTVYEGARVCPLDKSDRYNYHSWSFHNTVNRILEARLDNYDFILVDRGVLDHMAFLQAIKPSCTREIEPAFEYYKGFLELQDEELFFTVSPEEAIRREAKSKPFVGRVFNTDFLSRLGNAYQQVLDYAAGAGRNVEVVDGNCKLADNVARMLEYSERLAKK